MLGRPVSKPLRYEKIRLALPRRISGRRDAFLVHRCGHRSDAGYDNLNHSSNAAIRRHHTRGNDNNDDQVWRLLDCGLAPAQSARRATWDPVRHTSASEANHLNAAERVALMAASCTCRMTMAAVCPDDGSTVETARRTPSPTCPSVSVIRCVQTRCCSVR